MYPLKELNVGDIIYQYSLASILPRGITIGVAERNLYVDRNHEINLCAYWNTRISAKYEFNNKYSFYITDGRIASDIFCSLGRFSDNKKIIKKYDSLEQVKESDFYNHFFQMKEIIENNILDEEKRLEKNKKDAFKWGTLYGGPNEDFSGIDYEWECKKTKEFVQLHVDLNKDKWILTTSKERLGNLKIWFEDFDELDKNELHLLSHHDELDAKNLDRSSPYYSIVKEAKLALGLDGGVIPGRINSYEIEFMEFKEMIVHFCYDENKVKATYKAKTKIEQNGFITKTVTLENREKVKKIYQKRITPAIIENCFKEVSSFLSAGRLRRSIFTDDYCGTLIIHFRDGHSEKYDRGLARRDTYLIDFLRDIIYGFKDEA